MRHFPGFCGFFAIVITGGAACGTSSAPSSTSSTSSPGGAPTLASAFDAAATAHAVPRDLLVAIAEVEGGLAMPARRDVDPANDAPAAGPLMLRHGKLDTLARGASLSGRSELDLRRDADLALDAGAAVLAEVGTHSGARDDDLATWSAALEEMSGYADAAHRVEYAHRVFAVLARGGTFDGRDGETIALAPHDLPPSLTMDVRETVRAQGGTPDYPAAEWFPTSCAGKCDLGRGGARIDRIVIHDTEGGWDASVATLQNDPGKSVQYIIGRDGRVGQFVHEADTAWHAGNYYYNQRSIGIEHVGVWTTPYTEALYAASAALVQHLTGKYSIAADRAHIIGHEAVPNGKVLPESSPPCAAAPRVCETGASYGGAGNHRDPGDWEWATYMPRLGPGAAAKCNDVRGTWSCSYDKTQAFVCNDGEVVVEACSSCTVAASGNGDACVAITPPDPPPPPNADSPDDAGPAPSAPSAPFTGGPAEPGAPVAAHTPAPSAAPAASDPPAGGCSVSPAAPKAAASCPAAPQAAASWLPAALVAAIAASRRSRRR